MSKKKFVTMGAVVGTLMLTQGVFAAGIAMTPSQNALSVQSGETVNKVDAVPAYMYQDSNYFMLRDIGKIIGYQVDWDETTKKITMTKDEAAQNFDGLSAVRQAENVKKDQQTIVIDGNEYEDMGCLNIDGYNYFKLRDLAEAMDFICDWDTSTNTIMLTVGKESVPDTSDTPKPAETNISVDRFLDPELNQKVIKEDVTYVSGSKDYREIEKYIKENIDKNFNVDDYTVTEDDVNGLLSGYNSLVMRLDVNGVRANFGYLVTCLNGKAALITFIGEKNEDFDIAKIGTLQLSDEEAKQKAIEADGYDYQVDEQRIYRFFDMKDLKNKCEVETVYINDTGHYFATSHIFE
ncbi:stalk domain-containing protein [Anaerotignum sp.]